MQPFTPIRSTAVPLPLEDIDTDQIIPARFLKATTREGFGENLFRDWRFDALEHPKPDFVLNSALYTGEILVTGANFGCGSSREHAAWAIADYGFRVVVSSYFADIFRGNALNNGLLPLQVTPGELNAVLAAIELNPKAEFSVDLEAQTLLIPGQEAPVHFDIDAYKKECMLNGYDDIDYLLAKRELIEQFEAGRVEH